MNEFELIVPFFNTAELMRIKHVANTLGVSFVETSAGRGHPIILFPLSREEMHSLFDLAEVEH